MARHQSGFRWTGRGRGHSGGLSSRHPTGTQGSPDPQRLVPWEQGPLTSARCPTLFTRATFRGAPVCAHRPERSARGPFSRRQAGVRSPLLQRCEHSVSEGEPRASQRGGSHGPMWGPSQAPGVLFASGEQPLTSGQLSYPGGSFQEFTARNFPAGFSWAANPAFVCTTFPGTCPAWPAGGCV